MPPICRQPCQWSHSWSIVAPHVSVGIASFQGWGLVLNKRQIFVPPHDSFSAILRQRWVLFWHRQCCLCSLRFDPLHLLGTIFCFAPLLGTDLSSSACFLFEEAVLGWLPPGSPKHPLQSFDRSCNRSSCSTELNDNVQHLLILSIPRTLCFWSCQWDFFNNNPETFSVQV